MTSNFQIIPLLVWSLLFLLVGVIYALPMIIAAYRHDRHETAIGALDLYTGWTVVGWLAALVWSLIDPSREADVRHPALVRKQAVVSTEPTMKKSA